jgi:hypothetical protein
MGARRGSRGDVTLQLELLVLATQPRQLVTLGRAQDGVGDRGGFPVAAALLAIGLRDPVADRLGRWFELTSQVGWIAPGTNQLNYPSPELRRIWGMGLGH